MQCIKSVQKCAKYETCAICTGFIFCTFFETIFFLLFRDKRILSFFFVCVGGGGGGGGEGWGLR